MSRPTTPQPEQHGVTHQGQAPQVAVRDGNRLLCPCCGQTLMVLKEKRFTPPKRHHVKGDPRRTWPSLERLVAEQDHYQNGSKDEPPPQEPLRKDDDQDGPAYRADSLVVRIDPKVAAHEFPDFNPPPVDPPKEPQPVKVPTEGSSSANAHYKPPRDWNTRYEEHQRRRSKRPLEEATTYEMARLYAWAYYRLQRLAVQIEKEIATKQVKIDRLQTELDGGKKEDRHQQPTERPVKENEKNIAPQRQDGPLRVNTPHAQADLGVAPGKVNTTGNENTTEKAMTITTQRHAHANVGMAPGRVLEGSTTKPTQAGKHPP